MAGPPSTVYRLNYSRRRITDDSLRQQQLQRELPLRQDNYPYEEVDFSQNELSSGGLCVVLEVCRRCPKLRVLKLYKNQIDDGGAEGLAELCRQCPAIEEMHLSHNHFTAVGVEVLITAAEQARPNHVSPLWLRLEQNDVSDPDAVFRDLSTRLSVCNRMDEVRCTVRVCSKKQKVHLPFFHLQRHNRLRDTTLAAPPFGGSPSYRVVRDEASTTAGKPPQSAVVAKQGGPPNRVPAPLNAPSRSLANAPKNGMMTPNGTCAWNVSGANAARRFNAQSAGCGSGSTAALPPPPADDESEDGGSEPPTTSSMQKLPPPPPPPLVGPAASSAAAAPAVVPATDTAAAAGSAPTSGKAPTAGKSTIAGKATTAGNAPGRPPDEGTSENADVSSTPARQRKASDTPEEQPQLPSHAQPGSSRPSLVLDSQGQRRILPKQLEADGTNSQFVCPLCTFVIIKPVITSCSHLFCQICFNNWVSDQVSKQKKGMHAGEPVSTIPCPQPKCNAQLQKKDIQQMDKADATKVGAVALLQRMRNNLQIRCVHHQDHFKYPFGQDAERVKCETGMSCKWVGDQAAYEEHVCKNCPIEKHLGGPPADARTESSRTPSASPTQGSPRAVKVPTKAAEVATAAKLPAPPARSGGAGGAAEAPKTQKPEVAAAAVEAPKTQKAEVVAAAVEAPKTQKAEVVAAAVEAPKAQKPEVVAAAVEAPKPQKPELAATAVEAPKPQKPELAATAVEDTCLGTRRARYDYAPRETDTAQIPLKQNELVRIFEVTESGWAAGVRLCQKTGKELGHAGWFPETYLYPADHPAAATR